MTDSVYPPIFMHIFILRIKKNLAEWNRQKCAKKLLRLNEMEKLVWQKQEDAIKTDGKCFFLIAAKQKAQK